MGGDNGLEFGEDDMEIVLNNSNLTGPILEIIAHYINLHQGQIPEPIVKPIQSDDISKIVTDPLDDTLINSCFNQDWLTMFPTKATRIAKAITKLLAEDKDKSEPDDRRIIYKIILGAN